MSNTPLYETLLNHRKSNFSSFHTPGHKSANFFPSDLLSLDYTELPDTDALFEADGVILEVEKKLAKLFNTQRSMISAGGCTLAIQSMLKIARKYGKKMIFARNSHRTAINTIALLDIEPIWVLPKSDNNIFTGRIMAEDIETALKNNNDISACYLTSPNYYGELSDINEIAKICHKYNVLLLIDNAHGSHLGFLNKNLHPIHLGADMTACSLHKTLPVLTGGAVLNIGNKDLIEDAKDAMALFGSTSPSYLIMSSIDICSDYLMNKGGKNDYRSLENKISNIKTLINECNIIQPSGLCDPLRICINTLSCGISKDKQTEYFHGYNIEPEFCDGENAVFICTPFNSETDFIRLKNSVKNLSSYRKTINKFTNITLPKVCMTPRQAMFSKTEVISVDKSLNRIAGNTACPCPPGVPVVMFGEIISQDIIEQLKNYGFSKIRVVKE